MSWSPRGGAPRRDPRGSASPRAEGLLTTSAWREAACARSQRCTTFRLRAGGLAVPRIPRPPKMIRMSAACLLEPPASQREGLFPGPLVVHGSNALILGIEFPIDREVAFGRVGAGHIRVDDRSILGFKGRSHGLAC